MMETQGPTAGRGYWGLSETRGTEGGMLVLRAEGTACAKARRWKRTGRAFGPKTKQASGETEDKAK